MSQIATLEGAISAKKYKYSKSNANLVPYLQLSIIKKGSLYMEFNADLLFFYLNGASIKMQIYLVGHGSVLILISGILSFLQAAKILLLPPKYKNDYSAIQ